MSDETEQTPKTTSIGGLSLQAKKTSEAAGPPPSSQASEVVPELSIDQALAKQAQAATIDPNSIKMVYYLNRKDPKARIVLLSRETQNALKFEHRIAMTADPELIAAMDKIISQNKYGLANNIIKISAEQAKTYAEAFRINARASSMILGSGSAHAMQSQIVR